MVKKKLLITTMIFWCCVLLINVLRPEAYHTGIEEKKFWAEKISWQDQFDIIVTGDSRTLVGISPEAMQSILSEYKIANYGFPAVVYSSEYMNLAELALKRSSNKKIIVLGITVRSLLTKEKKNFFFESWRIERKNHLILNLYKHTWWLRKLFLPLSENDFNTAIGRIGLRNLRVNMKSGWTASRLSKDKRFLSEEQYSSILAQGRIDEEILKTIFTMTRKWTGEGISVFAVRIPPSPKLLEMENNVKEYNEKSIRFQFKKSGGVWLDLPSKNIVTYDGTHLRYDSAVNYSRNLALAIKKYLREIQ